MVKIKNKELYDETFKKINNWDNLSIKYYDKGNLKKGKEYEMKSDNIYNSNYYKIFDVTTPKISKNNKNLTNEQANQLFTRGGTNLIK